LRTSSSEAPAALLARPPATDLPRPTAAQTPAVASGAPPGRSLSRGLVWALSMLGLDVVEWIVLYEIVYVDQASLTSEPGGFLYAYFIVATVCMVVQVVGVVLVAFGAYRLGGVLQIASSVVHVPKGEGLIGVIGGVKAYRYPRLAAERARAAELEVAGGHAEPVPTDSPATPAQDTGATAAPTEGPPDRPALRP